MSKKDRPQTESAFTLFTKSARIVSENLPLFIIVSIATIAQAVHSIVQKQVTVVEINSVNDFFKLLGITPAIFAAFVVISIVMTAVLPKLTTELAKGKKPTVGNLWEFAMKYTFPVFALSVVSGFAIMGGFILLIIPGIILLRKFFLAPYVLVDQETGIIESLKISARMTDKAPGSIWGLIGVSLLIALPSVISVYGIGALATAALTVAYSAAPALRYQELKKLK